MFLCGYPVDIEESGTLYYLFSNLIVPLDERASLEVKEKEVWYVLMLITFCH